MKENRKTYILTSMICLLPILAGLVLYAKLPDQIATHWDSEGVPNGFQSKFVGVIVFPGILFLINLLMPMIMKMDPKYSNMSQKLRELVLWIIPLVACVCSGMTLSYGLGYNVPVVTVCSMLMAVLFILIGNYLPKTGQSYTLGFKLPWTLNSEENWNRTHRLAGFVMVIAGFAVMIGALTPWKSWIMGIAIAAIVVIPTVYSYLYYRKEQNM